MSLLPSVRESNKIWNTLTFTHEDTTLGITSQKTWILICSAVEASHLSLTCSWRSQTFFDIRDVMVFHLLLETLVIRAFETSFLYRTSLLRIVVTFPLSLWFTSHAYRQVNSYNLCVRHCSLFYGVFLRGWQDVWVTLHSTSGQSLSFHVYFPCIYLYIHEFFTPTCKCTNERVMGRLFPHLPVLVFTSTL